MTMRVQIIIFLFLIRAETAGIGACGFCIVPMAVSNQLWFLPKESGGSWPLWWSINGKEGMSFECRIMALIYGSLINCTGILNK